MAYHAHMMDPSTQEAFHGLLTDACAVLVRLVTLIPDDMPDARRYACALIVDQVMTEVNQVLDEPVFPFDRRGNNKGDG